MTAEHQHSDNQWATLIKKVAEGEHNALATIYDTTSSQVFGLLVRMLADRAAAEEVLLDVYKQAWRQASLYDSDRGSPLAWLLTIARSRALDRLRSSRREHQVIQALTTQPSFMAPEIDPENTAIISEQRQIVRSALGSIPPEQREVIELAYYSGLSQTEIAARLDQPLGTIKTRMRLGMMKLRDLLGPDAKG